MSDRTPDDSSDPWSPPDGPPPGYHQIPPGHHPWPPHAPAGGGYQLPAGYYAGPEDPLVSADFGGWWRRSFALLAAAWRQTAQVQLIWAVPLVAVGILGALWQPEEIVTFDEASAPDLGEVLRPLLVVLPFALIAVVLSLVAQLATLEVLVQRVTGRPVSVGQALRTGLRRSPALLGWQILAGLTVLVGAVFCLLPGIYAAIVLMILPPIILLERGTGIGRAFQLFHADFAASMARIATVIGLHLAFIVAEFFISAILSIPSAAGATTALGVVGAVISAGFSVATGVVISPLILTAYADMRARREPFSTAYLMPQPGPS